MINKLISPYEFNTIDFTEANILYEPDIVNDEILIECGGLTILGNETTYVRESNYDTLLDKNTTMYLSGICKFRFTDIIELKKERYNKEGKIDEKIHRDNNEIYESYSVFVFPSIGIYNERYWFNIIIKTFKPAAIIFDDMKLVDATEYCKNPQKYFYLNQII